MEMYESMRLYASARAHVRFRVHLFIISALGAQQRRVLTTAIKLYASAAPRNGYTPPHFCVRYGRNIVVFWKENTLGVFPFFFGQKGWGAGKMRIQIIRLEV